LIDCNLHSISDLQKRYLELNKDKPMRYTLFFLPLILIFSLSCQKETNRLPVPENIVISQKNVSLSINEELQLNILNSNKYEICWSIIKGEGQIDQNGKFISTNQNNEHTLVKAWLTDYPDKIDSCWISTSSTNSNTYVKDIDIFNSEPIDDMPSCLINEDSFAFSRYRLWGYSYFNVSIFDMFGNSVLTKNYGYGSCEKIKYDGNHIVAVGFSGNLFEQLDTAIIIKINIDGSLIWKTKLNGLKSTDIAIASDKKYFVIVDNTKLVKLDEHGIVEWEKEFTLDKIEKSSIAITKSNEIYIASNSRIETTVFSTLYKLSAFGEKIWNKPLTRNFDCSNINLDINENIFLSGKGPSNNQQSWDFYIVKMNSSGGILYEKNYGTSNLDYCSSLVLINDSPLLIGWSADRIAICKLNSVGIIEYWKEYPDGYMYSAILTNEPNIILIGKNSNSKVKILKTDLFGNTKI